ncbi:hypothetical protein AGMMS50267_09180 [Spirochaetia bacterium]|nr:hypothetical protein AGMMS50267_09180 [Spirochaetia bacterium]
MKHRKDVLALLLVVVPFMYTACLIHWEGSYNEGVTSEYPGTVTVENGGGKMVILVETMYPPSEYSVYRIYLRDTTTNGKVQITGASQGVYSKSVQDKYVRIELYDSVIEERYGAVPPEWITPYLINWDVESVVLTSPGKDGIYLP